MALTIKAIESAKPKKKVYRIADGNSLFLEIPIKGAKRWRYRFRYAGKENMLSLGVYPETSLKEARERRDEMKKLLSKGVNPSDVRREDRASSTGTGDFETIAREWFEKFKSTWTKGHSINKIRRLEQDVFPWIGKTNIKDVTAPELLLILRRVEDRGAIETAHRIRGSLSSVFRYAISTGRAGHDPAADLKGAIPPPRKRHFSTITKPDEIAKLLIAIDGYKGQLVTRVALKLAPLVFVRPGELRQAEWTDFDLEASEWRIPGEKMKSGRLHVVPLSTQAKKLLQEIYPLTGAGKYVFPSVRSKTRPMSENTINAALRNLGYTKDQFTGHGFRSMASTLLNEQGWNRDAIERQLAHVEGNAVRAAYNHADYLDERKEMMQSWSNYLEGLKNG